MNKYQLRVDRNQREVIRLFKKYGASAINTSRMGEGFPDLMVGYKLFTVPVEVKFEGKELNDRQRKWHADFPGAAAIVETEDDVKLVLKTINAIIDTLEAAAQGMPRPTAARYAIFGLKSSFTFKTAEDLQAGQ